MNTKWWTVQTMALILGVGGLVLVIRTAGYFAAAGVILFVWGQQLARENRGKR